MRLTIERMRTLVLAAGALVVIALVVFLGIARWRSHFNIREIPKKLGLDVQQEANGVVIARNIGQHSQFKIHASKVVQLKQGGHAVLHDVVIELFADDGKRVDRISGDEFEWDDKTKTATAAGPVEITLTRPADALAMASKAKPVQGSAAALANAAKTAPQGAIHVKTSGLVFDEKSGLASTTQRVEFTVTQGTGSSIGATFDSDKGRLLLDHSVELDVRRGPGKVLLHAQHAEFERQTMLCRMHGVRGSFRGGEASAGDADVLFRPDGSAVRFDATNGFSLATAASARITAPIGRLEFDEHNQPKHGRLEGGARLESVSHGRTVHGAAPTADLAFTSGGLLRHAHLERGVTIHSDEASTVHDGSGVNVSRDWRSPVADVDFRQPERNTQGQVKLASVTGTGGVAITSQTQRGTGAVMPSRMVADKITASFDDRQALSLAVATGHASLEQTTNAGARQTTSGDRIEASFVPPSERVAHSTATVRTGQAGGGAMAGEQIQSATVDGNVVLTQLPARKPDASAQGPLRATAGRAEYEGTGEWLHLTNHPRVENGGLQLAADKVDVSQESGDAFAHGNVKATWLGAETEKSGSKSSARSMAGTVGFGGQDPVHVVAAEAQVHQASGEATFRGQARLWQQANSISAPVIVLDRTRQTLVAHGTSAAQPVRVVMLSAGSTGAKKGDLPGSSTPQAKDAAKTGRAGLGPATPSVIRVRCGDLKYSEAERKAVMHGGSGAAVTAETGSGTSVSDQLELVLLPAGNRAGKDGGSAQVDRMTASGHVTIRSEGRQGTGERLQYTSQTEEYVLTGSAGNLPRLTDPVRGTVSGEALIFNSRDDSVSIEGGGQKTLTETVAPKAVRPK